MFNFFSKKNPPLTNTVKFNEIDEFLKNILENYKDLSIIKKLGFEFLYNNDEYKDFYEYDIKFYELRRDFVNLFADDMLKEIAKSLQHQILSLIYSLPLPPKSPNRDEELKTLHHQVLSLIYPPLPPKSPNRDEELKTCFDKKQFFALQNMDITLKMYEIITKKDLYNKHVTFLQEKK